MQRGGYLETYLCDSGGGVEGEEGGGERGVGSKGREEGGGRAEEAAICTCVEGGTVTEVQRFDVVGQHSMSGRAGQGRAGQGRGLCPHACAGRRGTKARQLQERTVIGFTSSSVA